MVKKNSVQCASSSVIITPPMGTQLAGYLTGDRRAKGVYDNLYAKILIIKKGSSKIVLISCDLVGVPSEIALRIRRSISKQTSVPVSSVMICATHTHTGPVTFGKLTNRRYLGSISKKIIRETVDANKKLEDCFIEHGSGELRGYAFNRRYFMKDGKVITNPGIHNPDVVKPAAAVDYSMNVIKVLDSKNKLRALVVNCTNHCDTVSGNKISADWPGYLSRHVKKRLGENINVLVLNGSAGDINHFDVFGKRIVSNINEAKRIGTAYGKKVVDICKKTKPLKVDPMGSVWETARVPVRKITKADLLKAKKTVREFEAKARTTGRVLESQAIARGNEEILAFFARGLLAVARKYRNSYETLELQATRLGQLALVCIGGEVFTEIGLAIKKNKFFKKTLIVELANGTSGYLPTKRAFREGGYEIMSTERNKMGESVESIILRKTDRLLRKLRRVRRWQ